MKSKIKYISMILIVSLLFSNFTIAQTFIGEYEIQNINGTLYHVTQEGQNEIDERLITLMFTREANQSQIFSFEQTNNIDLLFNFDGYYIYKLPDGGNYIQKCQAIENSLIVDYIEVAVFFKMYSDVFEPNDYDSDEYFYGMLDVPEAWMLTTGNENVVVAILDTGLEFDDEDFGPEDTPISNLFQNDGEDAWDDWDDPSCNENYHPNCFDDDGNGYNDDWQGIDLYEWYFSSGQNWSTTDNDVRPEYHSTNLCGPSEDPEHGSYMARIVAAKTNNDYEIDGIAGVAGGNVIEGKGGVKILPIKMRDWGWDNWNNCWYYTGISSPLVSAGIRYAREMDADIINMSFGNWVGDYTSVTTQLDLAYQEGIVLIAAAGNENNNYNINSPNTVSYPARNENVIAVGAVDEDDEEWDEGIGNPGSNEGWDLEVMAPGKDIISMDGTSFSSAMVSGTAALMKSVNGDITNVQIRQILRETTYQNPDYDFDNTNNSFDPYPRGWNEHFGFGRINTLHAVCAALDSLPQDIITNNNDIWDEPTYSKQDIIIESGAKLTITSTLMMDPSAKIIIEPGGKLIVDGGTITNLPYCAGDNLKWQGIEVWGDPNESQQEDNGTYEQGYLELKNGATIENAQTAILLGKSGDYNGSGGGIVKAYDSYFTNNAKSVHFYPFKNMIVLGNDPAFEGNNEAIFRNCEFTINESYFPDSQFYKHADVVKVKKIRFYACDFKRESNENTSAYCSGIESYDGGLSIHEYGGEPCTFEGLYTGIVITNSSTVVDYDCYIQNAVFTNNSRGIKLNDMKNIVSIRENTFHVGYNEPDKGICGASQAYGIFLDNSNTFVIEDNTFDKYTNAPPNGDYIGIEAFNTQTSSDEIVGNTFDGLTHANHTTNINWDYKDGSSNGSRFRGLAYYCNQQSNNNNDLFFTWDDDFYISGVQIGQGSETRTAGNTFTQSVSGYNIYNNTSHGVGYYYDSDNTLEIPQVYTSGAAHVTIHAQTLDADCNSGSIGHRSYSSAEKQVLENEYIASEANYGSVVSLYQSLEDGGNTDALNTEVGTSWPNDMWELRDELLGLSPYLTTKVLKTAADKTEVLPESILFEILSANPEELKKAELIDYLENKEQPLPEYMISILQQLAAGQTAKTVLQNDMADYYREKSRTAMQMLVAMQYDEVFDQNTYRIWLDRLGGMQADYKIIASFVQENNYTDALALTNLFPDLYNLQGNDLAEYEYYMDMLNLDILLKQENRSPMALSSTELNMVEEIANDSKGSSGVQARGLLEHFYGQHFCNCVNTTVDANKSASASIKPNEYAAAMGLKIQAEPNPATTWVSFDYELPVGSDKAQLLIRNTEGKQINLFQISDHLGQKVWDTSSLKSGTYIYELISGDLKQIGKIIIVK